MREIRAANDSLYSAQRHRTAAIPASITHIANYPAKLRIFRMCASRFWQVRCFFRGTTYTQSLKTENRAAAISLAKHFYHVKTAELYAVEAAESEQRRQQQRETFASRVPAVLAEQAARVARGDLTQASLRILRNRLDKNILPVFGTTAIADIDYGRLSRFVERLSQQGLSSITIQQHLVAVRKVLTHAYTHGAIPALPKSPTVRVVSTPRGGFTVAEYRRLVATARRSCGTRIAITTTLRSGRRAGTVDRYVVIAPDLAWLIRFMVNTFVRPSDIRNLQHQHITVVRGEHTYLRMNLPESKRHGAPIVSMPAAVAVYERLLEYHSTSGLARATDYLFLPEQRDRTKALEQLGWQFKYLQSVIGLTGHAAVGKADEANSSPTRTLYSLRHTAITLRLLYGGHIDLLTLARNARTSVEMVERFYASQLTAEMNIGLLHGRRTR
jgi:integrase